MAVPNVPFCSSSPQPNAEALFSPEELEALARIIRNRNGGFLPSATECDLLVELVQRHLGGGR